MKMEWPRKRLGEVCQPRGGGTPSKDVEGYWQGNIPWVSPKDMKLDIVLDSIDHITCDAIDGSAASLIPKDSVLIVVRSGILARTIPIAIAGRELTINQDLKALCPGEEISTRFLYYLLNEKTDELLSMVSRGATVHRLITEQIRDLDFVLPPLPEQQRIVALLYEAFAGLATAKANAKRNLQNARAIFESHLEALFGQHGEGGPTKQLGEVCGFQGGSQPPKSEFVYEHKPGYVRFLQIRDYASEKHLTYIPESSKNRLCNADDIMIGRYGASVGKILTGRAGAYNVALVKRIPDLRLLERNFFLKYLASRAF
jgi:type I restriction enzyme S subunit